jgi:anthranilate phosphoribosyltransferase
VSSFWPEAIGRLLAPGDLSAEEAGDAMRRILAGEASQAQIAAFLAGLRSKGETPEEMAGLADAILELSPAVEVPGPVGATSGTGGDGAGTINVSTLAALVAAGAGMVVANIGTRAVSSRCGSADLLEGLGVNIGLGADGVARCLAECGIAFLFSPIFHPSLDMAAEARRDIGAPSAFDFLGPLTNPARPTAQVAGVWDRRVQPVLAGVLAQRGVRAYVVRGEDGLDEITTTAPTHLFEVGGGAVIERYLLPIEMGVAPARPEDLHGGDVEKNVDVARDVLEGVKGPATNIVAVNAAAALIVGGVVDELPEGLERATESIDSGKAARVLAKWVEVSNRV